MTKLVELENSTLSLTVLLIHTADIEQAKNAIRQETEQNPDSFVGQPVVIEFNTPPEDPMFLALLVEFIHQQQMIPVGVRSEDTAIQEQASYAGLAVFPPESAGQRPASNTPESVVESGALIWRGTVRSGQQLYAKGRDLMVMGAVNPGAEVMADGHVHVFGKVLGKVFAGASGFTEALIFAKELDPELICIAGRYQLSEDILPANKQGFIQISLDQETLHFQRPLEE